MIAKRSSLVMALLLALPQAALALGLGNIHVKSHLDQPLDARIDLLDATPAAMQSLSVGLASRLTFAKYGLNWPPYLEGAQVEVVHGAGGRLELHLTSPLPVTDPIVTLLVKANWSRGVLFREYTILLNPPVYVPRANQPRHVAVAAPVVGGAARTGELPAQQNRAAPVSPPASATTAPVAGRATMHSIHVRPGETLSGLASRFSGGGIDSAQTRRWMVAIYRLNPQAFAHNMNLLRSGAVLQMPSASAVAQVSRAVAWKEINRQDSAWQASQGSGGASGRLRLVAPQGGGSGTGTAAAGSGAGTSAAVGALQAQVNTLQSELAQEKRLVQLKSAALAALQAQVAAGKGPAGKAPAPTASAPRPAAHPSTARPAVKAAHAAPPSALGQMLRRYWWALLALVALGIAYVLARVLRSRRESAADELLSESADSGFAAGAPPAVPMVAVNVPPRTDASIDVREATHEQPRLVMNETASPVVSTHVPADQTMSSETALNLEQGDPLAEADFHMAYGLYDQAADLIRIAIQREPERRDLKLKLLEVFFVWGNKEQFVELAHELAESREQGPAGEWDKVVIMGRQLAPDDALFADAPLSGAASQGVDLDLEGGQGRVDFDLMGGALPAAHASGATSSTGSFDLDIGAALGEDGAAADTVSSSDLNATLADLEATGSETGVTQEMAEHPLDEMSAFEPVEPTVEQPALQAAGAAALRDKVEALSQGSDRTAELAIDDLGLDLGAFETTVQPSLGGDSPTLVAGLDEHSRGMLAQAEAAASGEGGSAAATPNSTGTTSAWHIDERELENLLAEEPKASEAAAHEASETSRLNTLVMPAGGVDFDLGAEPEAKPSNGNGLDFDIGAATMAHEGLAATHESPTAEHEITDFEPVTMSEVGTKLDLARAYMDMGDPEGARSILEEVIHEGSDAQRQEAGRLLESLPG